MFLPALLCYWWVVCTVFLYCICSGRKAFISHQLMSLVLSPNKAHLTSFCTRSAVWSLSWDDIAVWGILYFLHRLCWTSRCTSLGHTYLSISVRCILFSKSVIILCADIVCF
jgi:hypothetical protein